MGSKNTGSNKANQAAAQIKAAEDRVRDEYGRVRTSKLQSEIAKGPTVKSSSGDIKTSSGALRQGFKNTALGRMGFDPSMIGRSDLPTTNTQGNITAPELNRIGAMRDVLAGKLPGQVRTREELEQLSQFNRVLGLNPTSGMGIMGSLRQNFGGLEAQRDFARLGNMAKGIGNLMPGRAFVTGLLNKIPGVNLPTEFSMSPINYNITDRMSDFYGAEGFNPMLSLEDQEMYSDPFLNRVLFGDPVVKSPIEQMTPMQRPDQPATWQFSDRYGGDPNDPFGGGPIALAPQYQSELMGLVGPGTPGFMSSGEVTLGKGSAAEQMGLANTQDLDGNGIVDNLDSAIAANAYAQNQLPGSALFTTDIDSDQMKENIALHTSRMNALNQPQLDPDIVQQNQAMGLNGFTGYF